MKKKIGMTLFVIGLVVGGLGVSLTATIILAPIGLPMVLMGVGMALPGLKMSDRRRAPKPSGHEEIPPFEFDERWNGAFDEK